MHKKSNFALLCFSFWILAQISFSVCICGNLGPIIDSWRLNMEKKIKVLVAKPGLDGHDRGAKVVAYGLRDAGMEVVHTGLRQTPDQIVSAAIQEDVDVIGLSILSGAHLSLAQRVLKSLRDKEAGDKKVLVGGIIPRPDIDKLKQMGVVEVFIPGTPIKAIAQFIRSMVGGGG